MSDRNGIHGISHMRDAAHIQDTGAKEYNRQNADGVLRYLSDEELEKLIAVTEAEPLLHPPKEFGSEIISRIHRKKERRKNLTLFSYSLKVFAAAAAAIGIMLIMPETLRAGDSAEYRRQQQMRDERMQERYMEKMEDSYNGEFMFRFNEKINNYCSQLNNRLNQLIGMEDNLE